MHVNALLQIYKTHESKQGELVDKAITCYEQLEKELEHKRLNGVKDENPNCLGKRVKAEDSSKEDGV